MDELRVVRVSVSRDALKGCTYDPECVVLEGKDERPCMKVLNEVLNRQLKEVICRHESS